MADVEVDQEVAIPSNLTWPLVIFATLSIGVLLILFIGFNRQDPARAGTYVAGDNCNLLTCPAGPSGPPGPGIPGPPGQRGERGEEGPQGVQGPIGPIGLKGDTGMCLANPACGVGPKGDMGDTGPTGPQGAPGFAGLTGPQGIAGPAGMIGETGPTGPMGQTGPTGPQGDIGPQGNFTDPMAPIFTVGEMLTLDDNATLFCNPGAMIDIGCLVSGQCPDFTVCIMKMNQLHINDTTTMPAKLKVGHQNGMAGSEVDFGDCNTHMVGTIKMCSGPGGTTIGSNMGGNINIFNTAGSIIIESIGSGNLNLRNMNGPIAIDTMAELPLNIQSGGSLLLSSTSNTNGVTVMATNMIRLRAAGVTGTKINIESDILEIRQPGGSPGGGAFIAHAKQTGALNFQNLMTIGGGVDRELRIFNHITLDSSQGGTHTSITSTDGIVRIGPTVELGNGQLFTRLLTEVPNVGVGTQMPLPATPTPVARVMKLQNLGFGGAVWISPEAPIKNTNDANLPMEHCWGTASYSGGPTFTTLNSQHVFIDDDVRIAGNLVVNGVLAAGAMSTPCSPSDKRFKENITDIPFEDSWDRLKRLTPTSYNFIEAYQKTDSSVGSHLHYGFIAQDVKNIIPPAVRIESRKVDGITVDDFHTLQKDMMIPDLVNVVKHLYREVEKLRKELKSSSA